MEEKHLSGARRLLSVSLLRPVQEIAAKHQLHPNQVSTWKRQAIEGPTEAEAKELHAKIGRLAVENDFCRKG